MADTIDSEAFVLKDEFVTPDRLPLRSRSFAIYILVALIFVTHPLSAGFSGEATVRLGLKRESIAQETYERILKKAFGR